MTNIYRAWINQPSIRQPFHSLHGTRCIVHDTDGKTVRAYFTDGDVHSMEILRNAVSRLKISEKD